MRVFPFFNAVHPVFTGHEWHVHIRARVELAVSCGSSKTSKHVTFAPVVAQAKLEPYIITIHLLFFLCSSSVSILTVTLPLGQLLNATE